MTVVPQPRRPGPSFLRIAIFGAWLGYGVWLYATGRLTTSEAFLFVLLVGAAIGVLYVFDAWWNRPIRPPGEEHREWNAGDTEPEPASRPVPRHSALDDLKFPLAMATALIAVMVLFGFPGGGFGAGLVAIGAIGLFGWLALNRAIGGP